jgi:hypothetical protein
VLWELILKIIHTKILDRSSKLWKKQKSVALFKYYYEGDYAYKLHKDKYGSFPKQKNMSISFPFLNEPIPVKFFVDFLGLFWPIFDPIDEGHIE